MSDENSINYQSLYSDEELSEAGSESASDISDPGTPATFPRATEDRRVAGDANPNRKATASKKSNLTAHETYLAILETVRTMKRNNIDLPIFLEGLSWGNDECINDADIKNERTSLLHSEELPWVLRTWHTPISKTAGP